MRVTCKKCGQSFLRQHIDAPCPHGRWHRYSERKRSGEPDEVPDFAPAVTFTRTSVMEIPCSWMPGGYLKIGGKAL